MSSEKTEDASPKRLREAREKGQVPKSRDLTTAAILLVCGGALSASGESLIATLKNMMSTCLRLAAAPSTAPATVLEFGVSQGVSAAMPIVLAATAAAALASFLQVGPLLSLKAVEPKLEKLNVIKGIGNLFTRKQFVELLKTLLKMLFIGYLTWDVLVDGTRVVADLSGRSPGFLLPVTASLGGRLVFRVGGGMLALGILDLFFQRWQHKRDQKMSKDEVKREYKDAEGDPTTRAERERMRREILEHNAVESVRQADVLVVNPTHLAIALRYDEEASEAPLVVAKGEEHVAARMIEAARQSGVPIMRDIPLARSLYELGRGDEVPEALYEAVAAVLRAAWAESAESE